MNVGQARGLENEIRARFPGIPTTQRFSRQNGAKVYSVVAKVNGEWKQVESVDDIQTIDITPEPQTTDSLPTLEGTPRQISWASDVRTKMLAEMKQQIERSASSLRVAGHPEETVSAVVAKAEAGLATLRDKRSAVWWIDHRNDDIMNLILAAGKGLIR